MRHIFNLDAICWLGVAFVALPAYAQAPPQANENSLQIVSAGVERSEDAPFVSPEFRFLAGDYVYFQFQVAGYGIQANETGEVRTISLTYSAEPRDARGAPLTPEASGAIKEELNAEDKNWTPKRRASFLLPGSLSASEYTIHLAVRDLIGKSSTERDIPFRVGGVAVAPTAALTAQDFQFLRNEDDNTPLEVPAYRAGDTVYARFNMTGYRVGPANEYHLSYGLLVNRPDGKAYVNQASAAELKDKSFYPVQFVPGNLSITTTRAAAHGDYVLVLTIRDLIGSQTYQLKKAFTIE